ncbi:MAG: condensation domain-containing protein, partial [Candidatus Aminicenantes bacterium]|nr:condensation domain-containing protein [Candidatus Aminicenantes bacterium]
VRWEIDLEEYSGILHKNYLLPLKNYRADLLLELPVFALEKKVISRDRYEQPRTNTEKKIVAIWEDILKVEHIGINDSFLELGGNSLKAVTMISSIYKAFKVELSLKDFFADKTIAGLSSRIDSLVREISGDKDHVTYASYASLEKVEKKDSYAVSFNQKRLWIIDQLEQGSITYNTFNRISLTHEVKPDIVKKILGMLMARHESLRTGFREAAGEPRQFIKEKAKIPFKRLDISTLPDREKEEKREQIYARECTTPFALSSPPLFRAMLVKLDRQRFDLIFNIHHIVSDGWSMAILQKEFIRLYEAAGKGVNVELEPLTLQYKDFAEWQNVLLGKGELKERCCGYWQAKIEEGFPPLDLPFDHEGNPHDDAGAGYRFVLDQDVKEGLKKLAADNRTTLFMVMFAAYCVVLSTLSGQEEIVSGIINAGREVISLHTIVGYFVNSLVVKNSVSRDDSFKNFLLKVNDNILSALQHQGYPFELVLDDLKIPYPQVKTAFNMLNMQDETLKLEREYVDPYHIDIRNVKFDMVLFITEYKNSIELLWSYKTAVLKSGDIEFIGSGYRDFLEILTRETTTAEAKITDKIKDYRLFGVESIEITGNRVKPKNNFLEFPEQAIEQSIIGRFEEQVRKHGDKLAVKVENSAVT